MNNQSNEHSESYTDFEADFQKASNRSDSGQSINIAFVGHVGVGKTPLIKALFGKAPLDEDGGTKDIYDLDLGDGVRILDTPGLGDVRENRSNLTRDNIGNFDIMIIVVDFEKQFKDGALNASSKEFIEICRDKKIPFKVCFNRIDIVRPSEKASRDSDWIRSLGINEGDRIFTAGYPLNGDPVGIQELIGYIMDIVETSGAHIRFAKKLASLDQAADAMILKSALKSAVIGAIPIPGADVVPITAEQISLVVQLSKIYSKDISLEDTKAILAATVTGQAGKTLFRAGIQGLKALGWLGGAAGEVPVMALAAAIAGASTYGLGHASKVYFKSNMDLSDLESFYNEFYKNWNRDKARKHEVFSSI